MQIGHLNTSILYLIGKFISGFLFPDSVQPQHFFQSQPIIMSGVVCQTSNSTIIYNGPFEICIGQSTGEFRPNFIGIDPNLKKSHYSTFSINEIDPDNPGTDNAEFIEILGPADSSLFGYIVVLFNGGTTPGSANTVDRIIDLDRFSTDSCGFFLIHGPNVTDPHPTNGFYDTLINSNNIIQNGRDAVALYHKTSFPGTVPILDSLVDAIVYHNANTSILDTGLLMELGETIQYTDNTASSLARVPDQFGGFVHDSTQTPGKLNLINYFPYTYVWLLTQNDSIIQSSEGDSTSLYSTVFTADQEGQYCVYGLSVYGTYIDFKNCGFPTISSISDSITQGYCGTLSASCQDLNVSGGFSFLSAIPLTCTSFDAQGTFQVKVSWKGTASGPYSGPAYTALTGGTMLTVSDTTCFISDPIPSGDTLFFRIVNALCEDTVTSFVTQFCDYCSLMQAPDPMDVIQVCETGPFTLLPSGGGIAQIKPSKELFISEYVEGSSNNKCLEFYNATSQPIDLAAGNYVLSIFYNGNTVPLLPISLSGTIAPGTTFLLCHNLADAALISIADQLSTNLDFNGDDAIVLTHNGDTIDGIGQVGFDPGGQWGSLSQSTQDNTLRRNGQICAGDTMVHDVFTPSVEWSGYPQDDFTGLGMHSYTAQEYIVDYYNYYNTDPLQGGVLLASGISYSGMTPAGTQDTLYVTAYRADYACESEAIPVIILSTTSNLVCNNKVNVSLPSIECRTVLQSADVLENPGFCTYEIKLSYPFGTNSYTDGNIVDRSHIGYAIPYSAKDGFGNVCWGYLTVSDKSGLSYSCKSQTISCFQLYDVLNSFDSIQISCQGKIKYHQESFFTDSACNHTYMGKWTRRIRTIDPWNNSYTCQDTFLIKKTLFSEVEPSDDLVLSCELFLGYPAELFIPDSLLSYQAQGLISEDLSVVPTVDGYNMYPSMGKPCNLAPSYTDLVSPLCGSGILIRREWKILDWCTYKDTNLVQYIKIEDTKAPRPSSLLPLLEANSSPHDCYGTITRYRRLNFSDCSELQTSISYSYIQPGTSKRVVFEIALFDPIRLPVGTHQVVFTAIDGCGFQTDKAVDAVISDLSPPDVNCIENTIITLDPQVCWSRVYAKDLDNGSRDNCQSRLHYAIASMDSVLFWKKYWTDKLEKACGKSLYWQHKIQYDALIDHWINCYVFKDFLDVSACQGYQVVLRVYEADHIQFLDDHVISLPPHLWYSFNTYALARLEINYIYAHKGDILLPPVLYCLDSLIKKYSVQPDFDPGINYLGYGNPDVPCVINPLYTVPVGLNGCPGAMYQDCMVELKVQDKTPPLAMKPPDLRVYCDGASVGFARDICSALIDEQAGVVDFSCVAPDGKPYYEIECNTENDLDLTDSKDRLGLGYGYYGCLIRVPHQYISDHDTSTACLNQAWSPIYCHRWLCEDRYDGRNGNIDSYFWRPTLYVQGQPSAKDTFAIWDNCTLDSASLSMKEEKSVSSCGTGWYARTWTVQDGCANTVSITQKIIVTHRSDFEVEFPEDIIVYCQNTTGSNFISIPRPIVNDDECERVSMTYEDEQFDIVSETCYKIVRTWTVMDECISTVDGHTISDPDVIINDTLTADKGSRYCVPRYLKDNGDGYMHYVQIIKVLDTSSPVIVLRDTMLCTKPNCVTAGQSISFKVIDDCNPGPQFKIIKAFIDLNAIGFEQKQTNSSNADLMLVSSAQSIQLDQIPIGKHLIYLNIEDGCGNSAVSISRLDVQDCKQPTPYCHTDLSTVLMPSSGQLTFWAKDFNAGSFDDCTDKAGLNFSFSENIKDSTITVTCKNIPNGKEETIDFKIWVTDKFGNKDFCSTKLRLVDGVGDVCTTGLQSLVLSFQQNEIDKSSQEQFNLMHASKFKRDLSLKNIMVSATPNPFNHRVVITIQLPDQQQGLLRIVDLQGRILKSIMVSNSGEFVLSSTDLKNPGVYYCVLQTSFGLETAKLVKLD